jgi:hypothetical protein
MDICTVDILLLFVLAITLSLIIAFNVIFVVDKKLSNIKINVPACSSPSIYVNTLDGTMRKMKDIDAKEEFKNIRKSNDDNGDNEYSMDANRTVLPLIVHNGSVDKRRTVLLKDAYDSGKIDQTCRPSIRQTNPYIRTNTFNSKILTADGITNNNITLAVPKLYMGNEDGYRGFDTQRMTLETPADVDQIGSIPVNDYTGQPLAMYDYW